MAERKQVHSERVGDAFGKVLIVDDRQWCGQKWLVQHPQCHGDIAVVGKKGSVFDRPWQPYRGSARCRGTDAYLMKDCPLKELFGVILALGSRSVGYLLDDWTIRYIAQQGKD